LTADDMDYCVDIVAMMTFTGNSAPTRCACWVILHNTANQDHCQPIVIEDQKCMGKRNTVDRRSI